MKSSVKIILKYLLLFIESMLVILIALIATFKFTLFNKDYVKNEFEKNNYYEKLAEEIKTEMSYYTNQSGFTDEVLDGIFTEEEVRYDFESFINSLYTGQEFTINTKDLENNLNKRINAELKNSNFKITNSEEIKKFVKQMATVYDNEIRLMNYIDSVKGILSKVVNMCDKVLFVLSMVLIICVLTSISAFRGKDLSVVSYTSSFLLLFFVLYVINSIDINHISIYSELVSSIIKALVKNVLNIIKIVSCLLLGLGLIIDILRKERRRHRHHHRSSSEEV